MHASSHRNIDPTMSVHHGWGVGGHRGWDDRILPKRGPGGTRRPGRIDGPGFGDVADNEDHGDRDAVLEKDAEEDHVESGVQITPHVFNNNDRDGADDEDDQREGDVSRGGDYQLGFRRQLRVCTF